VQGVFSTESELEAKIAAHLKLQLKKSESAKYRGEYKRYKQMINHEVVNALVDPHMRDGLNGFDGAIPKFTTQLAKLWVTEASKGKNWEIPEWAFCFIKSTYAHI